MSDLKTYVLNLTLKNVSPITIIENSDTDSSGVITIRTKKLARFNENNDEDKKLDYIPYLPANGIRGLLRRLATKKMVEQVKANISKDTIKDTDIHAMLSGSGVVNQAIEYKDGERLREKNPLLSLFGTGIVLSGKLKVANVMPKDINRSDIVRRQSFVKVDDILQGTEFAKLFTKEQIEAWEQSVSDNSKARASDREKQKLAKELGESYDDSDKTKKSSIQHYSQREYIVPNSVFVGSFLLENVTELELGVFLHALEDFVNFGRIGSSQNVGFGVVDIHIEDEDKTINMDRIADDNYIYNAKIDTSLSGDFKNSYEAYSKFLKEVTLENVEILSKL